MAQITTTYDFYDDEEIYASLWHFLINRLGLSWGQIRFLSLSLLSVFAFEAGEPMFVHMKNDDENDNESDQRVGQMIE